MTNYPSSLFKFRFNKLNEMVFGSNDEDWRNPQLKRTWKFITKGCQRIILTNL